ncbi:MAG: DUF6314 family protein [Pikeienuella sp.]
MNPAFGCPIFAAMDIATQSFFQGTWQMLRIIENVTEGVIGEFWGDCRFEPDGEGLRCREAGVLRFRGADYAAERVALWRFPGGGRIEVRYEDGRPFHDFVVDDPQAEELCGEDRYTVSYSFGEDMWLSRWTVGGPGKDYTMTTRYRRADAARPAAPWPEIALHG